MPATTPFLTFNGNCRAAMEFYRDCFAADLFLLPYSQVPDLPPAAAAAPERIMHATLSVRSGPRSGDPILMAADTFPGAPYQAGNNFSVMVHCDSLEELERLYVALSASGDATFPLQDTYWNARFGTLTDRFGTRWALNFPHPAPRS